MALGDTPQNARESPRMTISNFGLAKVFNAQ